jgi:hypothetical protein
MTSNFYSDTGQWAAFSCDDWAVWSTDGEWWGYLGPASDVPRAVFDRTSCHVGWVWFDGDRVVKVQQWHELGFSTQPRFPSDAPPVPIAPPQPPLERLPPGVENLF